MEVGGCSSEEEKKMRRVSARSRKSVIQTECYTKTIDKVEYRVEKEMVWRWGEFDVMLTDTEVEEMKAWEDGHEMKLEDYDFEMVEADDCCCIDYACPSHDDIFVEEFIVEDAKKQGREDEDEDEDEVPFDLEEYGWNLEETKYMIVGKVKVAVE